MNVNNSDIFFLGWRRKIPPLLCLSASDWLDPDIFTLTLNMSRPMPKPNQLGV